MNLEIINDLFLNRSKTLSVKIELLDWEENVIKEVQGLVESGSINVDGNSPIRRTATFSVVVLEDTLSLAELQRDFVLDKKLKVYIGMENTTAYKYIGEIVWFNLGTFVLTSASFSHSTSSIRMNLNCQDKMALWNGSLGGELQGGAEFFDRDINTREPKTSYSYLDIIKMTANVLGGLPMEKIIVSGVEEEIKGAVKYYGDNPIEVDYYFQNENGEWTTEKRTINKGDVYYRKFKFGPPDPNEVEGIDGYSKGAGETITSVFDDIIAMLGNFEYFFDLDGNFVFQEKRNYANKPFSPIFSISEGEGEKYMADFSKAPYVYDFGNNELIASLTNSPDWAGIKNNLLVYGTSEERGQVVYHLCIDKKPEVPPRWNRNLPVKEDSIIQNGFEISIGYESIVDESGNLVEGSNLTISTERTSKDSTIFPTIRDSNGVAWKVSIDASGAIKTEKYGIAGVGRISLANSPGYYLKIDTEGKLFPTVSKDDVEDLFEIEEGYLPYPWQQYIVDIGDQILAYNPKATDKDLPRWYKELAEYWTWRPENPTIGIYDADKRLYVNHVYNTEVGTFNARTGESETVRVGNVEFSKHGDPSQWRYFFDIIDDASRLGIFSINNIGIRTKTLVDDKITAVYPALITENIVILSQSEFEKEEVRQELMYDEQFYMVVSNEEIKNFEITGERDCFNQIRNLLWIHTNFNEVVTATGVPLYFLEPNTKVRLRDAVTQIEGDHLLTSYSFGLEAGAQMNMNLIKVGARL